MHNHGRNQGRMFAKASKLITVRARLGMFLNVVYGDLTSCSYLI